MTKEEILKTFEIRPANPGAYAKGWLAPEHARELVSVNPATGEPIASVWQADAATYDRVAATATEAFAWWRTLPAPRRGEVVHALGNALRTHKEALGSPGLAGDGQDPFRGRRRGAGDDRHVRLRGRPVAPALRPDDALGARPATACTSSGTRSGRSASSPRSTSRSRCGRGTRCSPPCAVTPSIWKPSSKTPLDRGRRPEHLQPRDGEARARRRLQPGRSAGP